MAPLNILIVGLGIAGPSLASLLLLDPTQAAEEKPQITILERSSELRSTGQSVDVRGVGVDVIRRLGLETAIRASTTGEEGVQFVDESNAIWAQMAADKSGKVQTGTSDIEILRGRLASIIYERSKVISAEVQAKGGKGIEYIFGGVLDQLEQDEKSVRVRFAKSGERRSFDVVVGADGLASMTRRQAFGAEDEEKRMYRLPLYGAAFSIPKGKNDVEWRRWFNAPGRRGVMVRPTHDPEMWSAAMFVIDAADKDKRLLDVAHEGARTVERQKSLMKEKFEGAGWECTRLLEAMETTEDFYYSTIAQVRMKKWSQRRVVLLGDAGYCASPISGMGTTLALTGAYNLAGSLLRNPNNLNAAFAQYETLMRPVVNKAQDFTITGPMMMNPDTWWGIWMRNALVWFICWSGLAMLMFKVAGPKADKVGGLTDFALEKLPEWNGWRELWKPKDPKYL
ncbi:hypothetical protein LTR78_005449 [Recurvomyces mirabilis]|uniref:FAD-binding domain-containing protein n=1 Tax=Recurvomyces mirabilis TaxID=574656 RepID=A0AAE1C1S8_9PEZI|nr:hypothetical protein LTR78_005449 [Recurvomyces mirabilis]KAK5152644.1 hypothetical protein LTS14_008178 [Recurvomyces mirabilis]